MPHTRGYRSNTRHLFQKDFKKNGVIPLGRYLQLYKVCVVAAASAAVLPVD
jgi:large subunit ribosomal protein L21e